MDRLRDLDKIAYVRFASVYRDFQDEQAFLNELKKLTPQKLVVCTAVAWPSDAVRTAEPHNSM